MRTRRIRARASVLLRDGAVAAKAARLRYVSPGELGIRRKRVGRRFAYHGKNGRVIASPRVLARIQVLAIPPAWQDVWICPSPNGHIQATGRDARGRKQYRYHPSWHGIRDQAKYDEIVAFGEALPALRRRVDRDLSRRKLSKRTVVATVISLMENTSLRVGNDVYADDNGSYGLTTLLDRHARIRGETVRFRFLGKGGRACDTQVNDKRLARLVRRCRDLPGQRLFQYINDQGEQRPITSTDVNAYLHAATGHPFTAKAFRTWSGTLTAALYLASREPRRSKAARKRALGKALELVSAELGNTVAVCRKCYVYPAVVDSFMRGELRPLLATELKRADRRRIKRLVPVEAAVLRVLEHLGTLRALRIPES